MKQLLPTALLTGTLTTCRDCGAHHQLVDRLCRECWTDRGITDLGVTELLDILRTQPGTTWQIRELSAYRVRLKSQRGRMPCLHS